MKMNVKNILDRMSEEDKIRLLSGKNNWQTMDFPEYGIPSIFMADGPCGLRKQTGTGDHLGIEDSVPVTATVSGGCLAATWNPDCAYENGRILGEEAASEQVDLLLAPAMNLVRSPLCGRNFEYFSEDPFLTGKIAVSYIKGVQSTGVGACPKHFAANNQETEREYINAVVDERALRETYLSGFEEAIKEGNPIAVMSALNRINGEYGAEHQHLLTDILREEWKFSGITISDWYGIVHQERAVAVGLDLEMPASCGVGEKRIKEALETGALTWESVNVCCMRLLETILKLEERKKQRMVENKNGIYQRNHRRSQKIAEEGIVLLKNENHVLPLSSGDQIAVIGCYAKDPKITLDGSARVISTGKDIPLDCMAEIAKADIPWAAGYTESDQPDGRELAEEAVALARESEKVVFFMGQTPGVEMEGHDREHLFLPKKQEELLEEILKVNSNVIVVLFNASAVVMPWADRVKGIFECFLAGQGAGKAIARLLYGEVNPSGKLPVSFTKCLEDTSAYMDFPGDGKEVHYSEGVFVGYKYYDRRRTELLYPFGFGLSYTEFAYLDCCTESEVFERDKDEIQVSVNVKNVGAVAGAEVVQLYVGMFDAGVRRPCRELKGFQKVFLEPQEEKRITFSLRKRDFAYYDTGFQEWCIPEGNYQIQIGSSSRDIRCRKSLMVVPYRKHLPPLTGWSSMGEMRATPLGEKYYMEAKAILGNYVTEDSPLFQKEELNDDAKLQKMPLRFLNLLTNGILDNDQLLAWIENVNRER